MARTVLLRHELRDGSSHFDWMIEPPEGDHGASGLITFRITDRIDRGDVVEFLAQRIGDHRAAYLDYEGPVSGDRGQVRRVAAGSLAWLEADPQRIALRGHLGAAQGVFHGSEGGGAGFWRFRFECRGTPGPGSGKEQPITGRA